MDVVVYAIVLAVALHGGWSVHDFVWGFWITAVGITFGAALIAPLCAIPARLDADRARGRQSSGASLTVEAAGTGVFIGGSTALLTGPLVFGPTGWLMNQMFPLIPPETFRMQGSVLFGVWMLFEEAAVRYWPLIAAALVARLQPIVAATATEMSFSDAAGNAMLVEGARGVLVALLAVLLRFVLGGLRGDVATYASYTLVALLLFPWPALRRRNEPERR